VGAHLSYANRPRGESYAELLPVPAGGSDADTAAKAINGIRWFALVAAARSCSFLRWANFDARRLLSVFTGLFYAWEERPFGGRRRKSIYLILYRPASGREGIGPMGDA